MGKIYYVCTKCKKIFEQNLHQKISEYSMVSGNTCMSLPESETYRLECEYCGNSTFEVYSE